MFIAKYNNEIVAIGENKEKLRASLCSKCKLFTAIEETSQNYVLYDGKYVLESEIATLRSTKAANKMLTAADVERALYKAKGIDFDDILSLASKIEGLDTKALKIELKANHFYRRNPYVSSIGQLLNITESQLDEFFLTNDYTKLSS